MNFSIDSTTLSFDSSSAMTQTITLTLVNDELVEHNQVIPLGIVAADSTADDLGDFYTRDAAGATANITIADDEQAKAKISFGSAIATTRHAATVAELTGTIDVPVTISHLPDADTTVALQVTGGSARETDDPDNTTGNPQDFAITTKSVEFTSTGDKTQNLTVTIEDDSVEEDDETIDLRVAAADNTVDDLGDYYERQGAGATARLTVTSADAVTSITLSGTAMPDSAHDNRIYVAENTTMDYHRDIKYPGRAQRLESVVVWGRNGRQSGDSQRLLFEAGYHHYPRRQDNGDNIYRLHSQGAEVGHNQRTRRRSERNGHGHKTRKSSRQLFHFPSVTAA